MNEHFLKILPAFFDDVASGIKPFEVRIDDRDPRYEAGDTLHLQEYADGEYTRHELTVTATYVLRDSRFCKEGFCIIGIRQVESAARVLTLEELEGMVGKLVWIVNPETHVNLGCKVISNIFAYGHNEDADRIVFTDDWMLHFVNYRKNWLAYDRQPEEVSQGGKNNETNSSF